MLTTKQLLAQSPKNAIAAMFNDINPGLFLVGDDVLFGAPQAVGATLTQVQMTLRQPYSAIDAVAYEGSFLFTYNRLNIADFAALAFIDYTPELPITTMDLLAELEQLFGCPFDRFDFVIEPITGTNAANYTLKTQPTSLRWVGTATVNVGNGTVIFIDGTPSDVIVKAPYAFTFWAQGGVGPYVWTAQGLPDGLVMNSVTGEVTGSTLILGPFEVTIGVTDSQGVHQQRGVTLTVVPATLLNPELVLGPQEFTSATIGVPYQSTMPIVGGNGVYSNPRLTQGTLPPGLSLSIVGNTLVMSGTPTAAFFGLIAVAVDSGDAQTDVQLMQFVTLPPMTINGNWMNIPVNTVFTDFLVIQGGSGDYYEPLLVNGSVLPPGVDTLIVDNERLEIRGQPTQIGTFPMAVQVLTAYGQSAIFNLSLTVT